MTWHITNYVERGEIDNRERDYVIGRIWLHGIAEPIQLDLVGNALEDLAGQCLRFENPWSRALPDDHRQLVGKQQGTVVEMTADRKVKEPNIPFIEPEELEATEDPSLFHWANGLYLEWHCTRHGRVVIESTEFKLEADSTTQWGDSGTAGQTPHETITESGVVARFLDQAAEAASFDPDADDDAPQGLIEAEAEAEAADFDLLRDRVALRLNQEYDIDAEVHNRIIAEERERLRRERGLPELEPNSCEYDEAETLWLNEQEAHTEELFEADLCPVDEERRDPLVERCQEFSLKLVGDIDNYGWAPENATTEHPLHEITNSLCFAAAKLAGALNNTDFWPDICFPGSTLVRLKKARRCLADARNGLQAVRDEELAPQEWIVATEREIESIRQEVQGKIEEIRTSLREFEDQAGWH